jgi:hypothetical protein
MIAPSVWAGIYQLGSDLATAMTAQILRNASTLSGEHQ